MTGRTSSVIKDLNVRMFVVFPCAMLISTFASESTARHLNRGRVAPGGKPNASSRNNQSRF
jgi:hypothetical protein